MTCTCSVAQYSLQHYSVINNTEELHVDAHIHGREGRERRKRVFHRLSEFQFVLVKMEGVSAQDIRAGQSGAEAGHSQPIDTALGLGQQRFISSLSPWSPRADCLPGGPSHTGLKATWRVSVRNMMAGNIVCGCRFGGDKGKIYNTSTLYVQLRYISLPFSCLTFSLG